MVWAMQPAWTPTPEDHERFMGQAIQSAREAADEGEVPVGALIVRHGRVVAKAHNQVEMLKDPTAHAEILAITQAASEAGGWRLSDHVLYVTKEPCPMCAGAIVLARLPLVVWGMTDPLRGGAVSKFHILQHGDLNHQAAFVAGVRGEECETIMKEFFRHLRNHELHNSTSHSAMPLDHTLTLPEA